MSSNEEAREQLRNLNPRQDTPLPDLPEAAPRVIIAADETFRKTIKKFVINGSFPSGSGWTGDHLIPLLKDQDCLRVLALLATLIRNGELDDTCRSYFSAIHFTHYRNLPAGLGPSYQLSPSTR